MKLTPITALILVGMPIFIIKQQAKQLSYTFEPQFLTKKQEKMINDCMFNLNLNNEITLIVVSFLQIIELNTMYRQQLFYAYNSICKD